MLPESGLRGLGLLDFILTSPYILVRDQDLKFISQYEGVQQSYLILESH